MNSDDLSKLIVGDLEKLVESGRARINPAMTGQWEIVIDGESEGTILTDAFIDEKIISIGGKEIGRFTDR